MEASILTLERFRTMTNELQPEEHVLSRQKEKLVKRQRSAQDRHNVLIYSVIQQIILWNAMICGVTLCNEQNIKFLVSLKLQKTIAK